MKQILVLFSHVGSGYEQLFTALQNHKNIQGYDSIPINSIESLEFITKQNHKLRNVSSIHMIASVFNHEITFKKAYNLCKFIFWIRDENSIGDIVKKGYDEKNALKYYCFRLRKIYKMSHYGIVNPTNIQIENYLDIKGVNYDITYDKIDISYEVLSKARECYQYYVNKISSCGG